MYKVKTLHSTSDGDLEKQLNKLFWNKEIISVTFVDYNPEVERLYTVTYKE